MTQQVKKSRRYAYIIPTILYYFTNLLQASQLDLSIIAKKENLSNVKEEESDHENLNILPNEGILNQPSLIRCAYQSATKFLVVELIRNESGFLPETPTSAFPIVASATEHLLDNKAFKPVYHKIKNDSTMATFWTKQVRKSC